MLAEGSSAPAGGAGKSVSPIASATTRILTLEEWSNRHAGDRRSACGILYHARDAGEVRRLVAEIERPAVAHAAAALGRRDTGAGRLGVQPHTLARLEREPGPPMVGAVQVGAVRDAREVGTAPRLECERAVFEVEFADRPIRPGPTFEAALSADRREHGDESSPVAGLTWSSIHYILYQTCMLYKSQERLNLGELNARVLLVLPQDILDRARALAGRTTAAYKLPVSLQVVLRALIEEALKRDDHPGLLSNIERQAQAVRQRR